MTKSKNARGIAAAFGILILILDSRTAFTGAAEGIELCLRSVIPSLFPFFVLSSIMIPSLASLTIPVFCSLIPEGAASFILIGFLGGYPVGAKCVADAFRSGQLSRNQAEQMLGFCSNAGPSFLFGLIGPMFPNPKYPWMLWGIHILGALTAAVMLPKSGKHSGKFSSGKPISMTGALRNSLYTMATVCGWIILFRVGIAFLDRWILWILPLPCQILFTGIAELANGCCALESIQSVAQRFMICSVMLALGGLCVTMQTISVTEGLRLRYYFPGKMIQCALSIFLSWAVLPKDSISPVLPLISLVFLVVFGFFIRKTQNNSSIPLTVGV